MEISYIAHSCFKIKGKDVTIVIDPYDPKSTGQKMPTLSADVLLMSHQHSDHNYKEAVTDYRLLVDTAGEFEVQDVFIHGIKCYHDNKMGEERGQNVMFHIEIDGLSVLHLGDLGHELGKEMLEQIPDVDVLLIPVGGVYTIDASTATKVISDIEPGIVVPMHYQTTTLTGLPEKLAELGKFLDEMGVEANGTVERLKLNKKSDIPEDTEVIVVSPQN